MNFSDDGTMESVYKDRIAKLEAERDHIKRDLADAMSGCCDCPMFKCSQRKLDVAVGALEFYAKHHHHLNTTAPNFAHEALKEINNG